MQTGDESILAPDQVLNDVVEKSPEDTRSYRVIVLQNGLRVLLISDEEPEESEDSAMEPTKDSKDSVSGGDSQQKVKAKAAAAMCVGTGYFSDPDDIPGLAHLVEHLVSKDSERYPEKSFLANFVTKHGGSYNAGTNREHTTFFFDVQREHFPEALRRFAELFINPLMKRESIECEVAAIDKELAHFKGDDDRFFDHLLSFLANPEHPMGKFGCGNEFTLKERPMDLEIDMYNKCHEFRRQNYSAHRMTLAVEVSETLDEVEKWVREIFAAIPNNAMQHPTFQHFKKAFKRKIFNKIYKVISLKDKYRLRLIWSLPRMAKTHYRTNPSRYVGGLIDLLYPGSIKSYLQNRMWEAQVFGQRGINFFEENQTGCLFSVVVNLTNEGYNRLNDVITVVFEFFEMLRIAGPREDIFRCLMNQREINFTWRKQVAALHNVQLLAPAMQVYPPRHYLKGATQMFEYNKEAISQFLEHLTPERCIVMVESRHHKDTSHLDLCTDQYYGVQYYVSDFDRHLLSEWSALKPRPELSMPPPLESTADLRIKPPNVERTLKPTTILKNSRMKIWYMQDLKFREPCGYIFLHLISPVARETSRSQTMFKVLVNMVSWQLGSISQVLRCEFWSTESGFAIKIGGYDFAVSKWLKAIIFILTNPRGSEEQFNIVKANILKYHPSNMVDRTKLAWELLDNLTKDNTLTVLEQNKVLMELSFQDFKSYVIEFYKSFKLIGYFHGNFTKKEAQDFAAYLEENMKELPFVSATETEKRVVKLPRGTHYCRVSSLNTNDEITTLLNYYQIGPCNTRTYVLGRLLQSVLHPECNNVLRTVNQLCYSTSCLLHLSQGVLGIVIIVDLLSTKTSIRYAQEKIEQFLTEFHGRLTTFQDNFASYITSFVTTLQSPSKCMLEEAERNWEEIAEIAPLCTWRDLQVNEAKRLKLDDFRHFFERIMLNANMKMLSVQVAGTGMAEQNQRLSDILIANAQTGDPRMLDACKSQSTLNPIGSIAEEHQSLPQIVELEYLQEARPDNSIDKQSIRNPVKFKGALYLHPAGTMLDDLPPADDDIEK